MKIYAIVSNENTACAETALCDKCLNINTVKENVISASKKASDIENYTFFDCSENDAIECTNCGDSLFKTN